MVFRREWFHFGFLSTTWEFRVNVDPHCLSWFKSMVSNYSFLVFWLFSCLLDLNACRVSNSSPGVVTVTYLSGAIQWWGSGGVGVGVLVVLLFVDAVCECTVTIF